MPSQPGDAPQAGAAAPVTHHLAVVDRSPDRRLVTSLVRGHDVDDQLACGRCAAVLARSRRPLVPPAPLLLCPACGAVNDPTQSR